MYCCGAGTAADTEMTTQMIASQLELQRLHTGRVVPVASAATLLKQMLFRYQGHISAALVLGGVDSSGPHIYCIYPHGSVDKLPYSTMGKFLTKSLLYLCALHLQPVVDTIHIILSRLTTRYKRHAGQCQRITNIKEKNSITVYYFKYHRCKTFTIDCHLRRSIIEDGIASFSICLVCKVIILLYLFTGKPLKFY